LVVSNSLDGRVNVGVTESDGTSSGVCGLWMEAMGAGAKSCRLFPIEIEEARSVNSEVLSSWTNHTIWLRNFQSKLGVVCSTNNQCIVNSCGVVTVVISNTELDTGKLVISNFEVVETNVSDFLGNGTVSSILPTNEVIEVGSDGWILPEWITLTLGCVFMIICDTLAWEIPRNHIMEDT